MPPSRREPWQVALLCAAVALGWQWLIVAGRFQGRWSALFVAGDRFAQSPEVAAERTYVFPASDGYDGQFYHAIAHDPLDLRGTDRFIDAARFRYPRILISGLSYLLGCGRLFWIDRAYRALELAAVFLGVFSVGSFAVGSGRSAWWGAAFLALPATFFSLERELTDLPLCALIAAALLAAERGLRGWCWIALAAAGLDREMGIVAAVAFAIAALYGKRLREAGAWALATVPALLWYAYVMAAIPGSTGLPARISSLLSAIVSAVRHPYRYPFASREVHVLIFLDRLAMAGALAALVLGFWFLLGEQPRKRDTLAFLGAALAAFGVLAAPKVEYTDVYSFARQNSPLFLVQLMQALRANNWVRLGPLAAVLPRSLIPGASLTYRSILYLLLR